MTATLANEARQKEVKNVKALKEKLEEVREELEGKGIHFIFVRRNSN